MNNQAILVERGAPINHILAPKGIGVHMARTRELSRHVVAADVRRNTTARLAEGEDPVPAHADDNNNALGAQP